MLNAGDICHRGQGAAAGGDVMGLDHQGPGVTLLQITPEAEREGRDAKGWGTLLPPNPFALAQHMLP